MLGGRYGDVVNFLLIEAPRDLNWMGILFEDMDNFEACFSAYYIIMLMTEFISKCKNKAFGIWRSEYFLVPPMFFSSYSSTAQKALQLILNESDRIHAFWKKEDVQGKILADMWDKYYREWDSVCRLFPEASSVLVNPIRDLL